MSQGTWQRDQMGASCKQQPQPGRNVACVKNCGFFGNDTTLNMCPNCYRAHASSHADSSPTDPTTLSSNPSDSTVPLSAQTSGSLADSPADPSSSAAPEGSLIADSSPLYAIDEDDGTLLARASLLDPAAASVSRARFPRVQSATASESRDGDSAGGAGECCDGAKDESATAVPADSLVRTNASRQLDVEMQPQAPSLSTPVVAGRPALSPFPSPAPAAAAAVSPSPLKAPSGSSKPNRCQVCRKKVGLTGFKCRCKGLFCGVHRYDDKHSCTFDYKAAGREAIAKANPVVVADKIVRF